MQGPFAKSIHSKRMIVVFCGHPCSGKSSTFDLFLKFFPEFCGYEMDQIRLDEMEGPIHDLSRRAAAYRVMHFKCTKSLKEGRSVALSANYFPMTARAELAGIAQRTGVDLYVVQIVCDAPVAVARFLQRQRTEPRHAGGDLTVSRVRDQASNYEPFDGALTIDTTTNPRPRELLGRLQGYLRASTPVDPSTWPLHWYLKNTKPQMLQSTPSSSNKLSQAVLRAATKEVFWNRWLMGFIVAFLLLGLLPLLGSVRSYWPAIRSWGGRFARPASSTWADLASWATFGIAAAGIVGIFLAFFKETSERWRFAKELTKTGEDPLYQIPSGGWAEPPDLEIYHAYRCRMPVDVSDERMPVRGLPIYFLILPELRKAFSALVKVATEDAPSKLHEDATRLGLDWNGFARWRWVLQSGGYALKAKSGEENLRCLSVPRPAPSGDVYESDGFLCHYADFISKEYSVNLWAPGTLPDMRQLFEGAAWDGGELDLSNCEKSAKRYSMRLSITGLLITDDGFFVLQRRSGRVASGIGSLGASVTGAVDYRADAIRWSNRKPVLWNLEKTVTRELLEETGIPASFVERYDPKGAFIGAGFSLRYGRDPSYYSLHRTSKKSWELGRNRESKQAKDRWEVDHLEFLEVNTVSARSIESGEVGRRLSRPSRHLMGALYAWAKYAGE
jgi:predicted kinase/8-oxo-dGTP pyrophosphatase MutT (NUDIX family)